MKRKITRCLALAVLVAILQPAVFMPVAQATDAPPTAASCGSDNIVTGPQVAARVQELKRTDRDIRIALEMFERNGARPKIEDSISLTGEVTVPSGANHAARRGVLAQPTLRPINFTQQETFSDQGVEIVLVPTIANPYEWQGTIIFRLYDDQSRLIRQWVSNIVSYQPSPLQVEEWPVVYELAIEGGSPFLMQEGEMYTSFALGVPVADHPARTGSAPSTIMLPWQVYEGPPSPPPCGPLEICQQGPSTVTRHLPGAPIFQKAAYKSARPATTQRQDQQRFPVRCGTQCTTPVERFLFSPPVRRWAGLTSIGCGAGLPACGAFALLTAGTAFVPCMVRTCIHSATASAWIVFLGY